MYAGAYDNQPTTSFDLDLQANTNPGLTYAHAPFVVMGHDLNATACESWFNLGEGELALSSLPVELPEGIVVEHVESCNSWADQNPVLWALIKTSLRKKYFSPAATHKPRTSQYMARAVNVAVHVRRGDALTDSSRCIPNAYIAGIMQQVATRLATLTSLPINFQVSQAFKLQEQPVLRLIGTVTGM